MSTSDELRAIAVTEFSSAGYIGTSLQRIAEVAGLSKSSVLYHYASKEALLEAALAPAVEAVGVVLGSMESTVRSAESRHAFIADFVDCLLQYRLEIHIFINQSRALVDIPIIDRANAIIEGVATYFFNEDFTLEQKMRFGIALGGAAYSLAAGAAFNESTEPEAPVAELRVALITVLTELLDPVPVRLTTTPE